MAGRVFFAPVGKDGKLPAGAIGRLFAAAGLGECFRPKDLVALKLHFGEPGNRDVWRPEQVREVVAAVKAGNALPFLTDANVLYRSLRHNAVEHLAVAHGNGFSYESCGAPLIIADGLRGDNSVQLPVPGGRHHPRAKIAAEIAHADALVALTHVTGHMLFGLGAALKNLGMGSGSSAGKQMMHDRFRPSVDEAKCIACGACAAHCPTGAITVPKGRKAQVELEKCVGCGECVAHCPTGAIPVQWGDSRGLQERTVEFCAAILAHHRGRCGFVSLVTGVTGQCDCMRERGPRVCADAGALAGRDPVAIDQAALDMIAERGGREKLQAACPGAELGIAQEYAEQLGIGSRKYELVEV
jgi:hypothetical protein